MFRFEFVHRAQDARVLVVTQRKLQRSISRSTIFEFEDLIAAFDSADIIAPELEPGGERGRLSRMVNKAAVRLLGRQGPEPEAPLDRKYDLVFVSCEDVSDLTRIGSLAAWLDAAQRSVCYVEELWAVHVDSRPEVQLLGQFDQVLLSCSGAVEPVTRRTGTPCEYLPVSVDAALFCPYPHRPERTIDVYNMGRRSEPTHQALLREARERDFFYLYDTFTGNLAINPPEHRQLFGNIVKRTKFFVANRAKVNEPGLTSRQEEIGSRHFEGAAGGAVVVGEPLTCPAFDEHLDWTDAVVPMPYDAPDIVDRLAELEKDVDRIARIRADNVRNCLLRHDWAWRWAQTLKAMGMEPLPQHGRRVEQLQELAAQVR